MNDHPHSPWPDLLKEIENDQRNTVWPGPLVNSRGVEEFFWKGSPKPTIVQRTAAWLFGLTFMGIAFSLFYLAWNLQGSAWAVFGGGALLFALIGIRHIGVEFLSARDRGHRSHNSRSIFLNPSEYTNLTWAEDMARQGCDQSTVQRPE